MEKLAVHGGEKTINRQFKRYNPIDEEERVAVNEVMRTGVLSKYLGIWSSDFYGGPKVQEFERAAEKHFGVMHAIVVNSLTSGLIAAVGAAGVEPGDEVILSPWTMSATATAILWWNAIPVFADIEDSTFTLNPVSIVNNITPYTKAIMPVDIYGHSADMDPIIEIAKKHNLKVISDTAQAPNALYKGKYAGTIAHIGAFSLNYHKHIHTGEGGILVTNDDKLAERLQLIRNHAEAVVGDKGVTDLTNMIGANFRMGEIEAAIGIEQLKKLKILTSRMTEVGKRFTKGLKNLIGLRCPIVKDNCTHVYYAYPLILNSEQLGVPRDAVHAALVAEGVPIGQGYTNLHLLPMYQKKIAYGKCGFPWSSDIYKGNVNYNKGICPIAEELHEKKLMSIGTCMYSWTIEDVDLVIKAFHKVWSQLDKL